MFQDPTHPEMQQLAQHHAAGTQDQIAPERAATAVTALHQADPRLARQVTDQHYARMSPPQLRDAAQHLHETLRGVASSSPEAARLAAIDPNTASAQQVAAMHEYLAAAHPDQLRDALIAGAGVVAVGALAAFAAHHYLQTHNR